MLRRFEVRLLAELGYAMQLTRDVDNARDRSRRARTITYPTAGPGSSWRMSAREPGAHPRLVRGTTLLALAAGSFPDADSAAEAKRLMRDVLDHHLEERRIVSRRVVRDLSAWKRKDPEAMIELGVNIDHVATLRQARRTHEPDPVWAAVEAHLGGADGITVHLREDRRHIQDEDVRRLRELVHIKLNLEMAATKEMIDIACRVKPEMAMLVPEGRHEITTEGGLDVAGQEAELARRRAAPGRCAAS